MMGQIKYKPEAISERELNSKLKQMDSKKKFNEMVDLSIALKAKGYEKEGNSVINFMVLTIRNTKTKHEDFIDDAKRWEPVLEKMYVLADRKAILEQTKEEFSKLAIEHLCNCHYNFDRLLSVATELKNHNLLTFDDAKKIVNAKLEGIVRNTNRHYNSDIHKCIRLSDSLSLTDRDAISQIMCSTLAKLIENGSEDSLKAYMVQVVKSGMIGNDVLKALFLNEIKSSSKEGHRTWPLSLFELAEKHKILRKEDVSGIRLRNEDLLVRSINHGKVGDMLRKLGHYTEQKESDNGSELEGWGMFFQ